MEAVPEQNVTSLEIMTPELFDQDENNAQFFGFPSSSFMNFFFNMCIDCWKQTLEEVIISEFHVDANVATKLGQWLHRHIFMNGKLRIILTQAEVFAIKTIFNVPPQMPVNQRPAQSIDQIKETIKELEIEIQKLKDEKVYIITQCKGLEDLLSLYNLVAK